jgi:DNA invertase Pin-like site-specific DNA recombinase
MTDRTKFTAVYLRVSSRRQDTASQEPDIERWLKAQELVDSPKLFRDRFTGRTMSRPQWDKLWAAVERGEVERIVVWRLDRLGRTASGLTRLFDELQGRGVNLVSLKDGLDLATPAGRLMANVLASVAQYETEVRAERTLAGQEVARKNGKTWGGSRPGRLLKVTAEQIDVIAKMHAAGEGKAAMARATGLSRPTIYNVLAQHLDKATA